ncbi:MAG: hypothetical protein P4M14_02415 [Gammaproteobacteria bacterium]|nr:hypothetical protein [Gammaproteobacteria bacterium]
MPHFKVLVQYQANEKPLIMDVEFEALPSDLKVWGWDHFAQTPIYAPADAPSHQEKLDGNLNHRRKVEFESHLAFGVLKKYDLFLPTLHKLGGAIADCIDSKLRSDKEKENGRKMAAGAIFKKAFFSDKGIFGTFGAASTETDLESYQRGMTMLRKGKSIERIFSAHIAALKIYREVLGHENDRRFHDWWREIRGNFFVSRGREKENVMPNLVDFPGIEVIPTLKQKIQLHRRAIDKTTRDFLNVTPFVWDAYQKEIPFVAGPSGTASECFVGLKTVGKKANLTAEEIKEYVFCCMGYLVSGGAHSLHEVYVLCESFNLKYVSGRYEAIIPAVFKSSSTFKRLVTSYSDVIQAGVFTSSVESKDENDELSALLAQPAVFSSHSAIIQSLAQSQAPTVLNDNPRAASSAASTWLFSNVQMGLNPFLRAASTTSMPALISPSSITENQSASERARSMNFSTPLLRAASSTPTLERSDARGGRGASDPMSDVSFHNRQFLTPTPCAEEPRLMSSQLLNQFTLNPKPISPAREKAAKRNYTETEPPMSSDQAALASFRDAKRPPICNKK